MPGTELSGGVKVILEHVGLLNRYSDIEAVAIAQQDSPEWFNQKVKFCKVDSLFDFDLSKFDLIITTYYNQIEKTYIKYPEKTIHFCQGYEGDYPFLVDREVLGDRKPEKLLLDITRAYSSPVPRFSVASWLTHYLAEKFGGLNLTLGQGIDLDFFYPAEERSYHCFRILIAGDSRLRFKGVKEALQAASLLKKDHPTIQIVRLNPYDNHKCEINWANIDEYHYAITTEKVAELYRSCDLLVFVPYKEGFGLPALEGMACRLPTVLSDIAPFRELSNNGETSLLVSPDINEIVNSIKRLLADDLLRETLAVKGLMRAHDYGYHRILPKLNILLRFFSDYLKKYKGAER